MAHKAPWASQCPPPPSLLSLVLWGCCQHLAGTRLVPTSRMVHAGLSLGHSFLCLLPSTHSRNLCSLLRGPLEPPFTPPFCVLTLLTYSVKTRLRIHGPREQLGIANHERHSLSQAVFFPVPLKTRYMESLEYEIAFLWVVPCSCEINKRSRRRVTDAQVV